jgi:hypothetical protein
MEACRIQWINAAGRPTPDGNPAVGRVRTKAHVFQRPDGTGVPIPASEWFPICAVHAARLREPGMHVWEWDLSEAPPSGTRGAPPYCGSCFHAIDGAPYWPTCHWPALHTVLA